MKMGSSKGIDAIQPDGEIYICPVCNYTDGFHVAFNMNTGTERGEIVLICPACHNRFTLGWKIQLSDN